MNQKIYDSFNKAVNFSKDSKLYRIIKKPSKFIFVKIIQLLNYWFDIPVKRRSDLFWGDDMLVIIPEAVSSHIYLYKFYEFNLTNIFLKYLKPGMVLFDIGAHFGYYTLLGSVLVGNTGQVHSFEPTPSTFNLLKENILHKKNIILNNNAVYSERKSITLTDFGIKSSAFNYVVNTRFPNNTFSNITPKEFSVESISIDEYLIGKEIIPNFIKIDAEGAEYEIILGMEETIKKYKPLITVEIGDYNINIETKSIKLIEDILKRGYRPYESKDGLIIEHNLLNKYLYNNLLFVPANK